MLHLRVNITTGADFRIESHRIALIHNRHTLEILLRCETANGTEQRRDTREFLTRLRVPSHVVYQLLQSSYVDYSALRPTVCSYVR